MNLDTALLRLLIFPGLLYALPLGWLALWLARKMMARLQRRIGPPFFQPFFDFIKLMGKQWQFPTDIGGQFMVFLPLLSIGSLLGVLTLLPLNPTSGFAGDVILLAALLEVPAVCSILAGFSSRSLYGQIGAAREAILTLAYNLPLLEGLFVLAIGSNSLRLVDAVTVQPWYWRALAALLILACLPAKLGLNPFSIANAEQEIYAGPLTEIGGPPLAMWEMTHALEWVALSGLVASLVLPDTGSSVANAVLFTLAVLLITVLLATLAAGNSRLRLDQAVRLYWGAGLIAGAGLIVMTVLI